MGNAPPRLPDADLAARFEQALAMQWADEAAAIADVVLSDDGRDPAFFARLGLVAVRAARIPLGLRMLDRSLDLDPMQPATRYHQGLGRLALGDAAGALASFERARELGLDTAELHHRCGDALQQLARHEDAVGRYGEALERSPALIGAWNNRGTALLALSRFEAAARDFRAALERQPGYARSWSNLSRAQRELGLATDALASADRALALAPDDPGGLTNRGCALWDLQRRDESMACFERALDLHPDFPPALANLASAMQDLKRDPEAIVLLKRLLALAPDWHHARADLLWSRMRCCDWRDYDSEVAVLLEGIESGHRVMDPLQLLSLSASASLQLKCARAHAQGEFAALAIEAPQALAASGRIRVAYLSADFRDHAVSFLLAGLIEAHDRDQFEILAVALRPLDPGPLGRRLAAAFDRVIDVSGLSDTAAAACIRHEHVDILVDLGGHTAGSRSGVLLQRPAPVQVNYLGFPGTMGHDAWDYILADDYVVPWSLEHAYSERVVRLPASFQVNDASRHRAIDLTSRADEGLPEQAFVYCCFNHLHKIVPSMFDRWMRILGSRPDSVLWLVSDSKVATDNLRKEAMQRGVDPARLIFGRRVPYERHLDRLALADLFLDTLPFNAGTTASDALWSGLPVLTCSGEAFAARMAGSLLRAVGLPELIAPDPDAYEATALRLADDVEALRTFRTRLAANRCTCALFDTDFFRRHLEEAYRTMVLHHRRGEAPAAIAVPSCLDLAGSQLR